MAKKEKDPLQEIREKMSKKERKENPLNFLLQEFSYLVHTLTEKVFKALTGIEQPEDTIGQKNENFAYTLYEIIYYTLFVTIIDGPVIGIFIALAIGGAI
jgi:hypothetical protein